MDIQREKRIFANEFIAHGASKAMNAKGDVMMIPTVIVEPKSDDGEKIEDYFERILIKAYTPRVCFIDKLKKFFKK